jgi:hypothetical protein
MKLVWTKQAWDDYLHWRATDHKNLQSINDHINDIRRSPLNGLGDPNRSSIAFTRLVVAPHDRRAPAGLSRLRERRHAADRNRILPLSLQMMCSTS